jgi:hypothetical protein
LKLALPESFSAIVPFKRKYTHRDGTIGTVTGSEISAFAIAHFNYITIVRRAFHARYRTAKYPWMKTPKRLLLARLENNLWK